MMNFRMTQESARVDEPFYLPTCRREKAAVRFQHRWSSSSNQTVEADLATSPLPPGNNPARERDFDTLGD